MDDDQLKKRDLLNYKTIKNKFLTRNVGIFLVLTSFIFYCSLLFVPFLPYTIGKKAVISSIIIVLGEISFWIGGFILGKELISKYKKYLNPINWLKK